VFSLPPWWVRVSGRPQWRDWMCGFPAASRQTGSPRRESPSWRRTGRTGKTSEAANYLQSMNAGDTQVFKRWNMKRNHLLIAKCSLPLALKFSKNATGCVPSTLFATCCLWTSHLFNIYLWMKFAYNDEFMALCRMILALL